MKKITFLAWLLVGGVVASPRVLALADIAGEWAVDFSGGDVRGEADMRMYVKQDGSRLSGYIDWNASADSFPLKGTITDDGFVIVWTSSVNGVFEEISFKGTVKGEEITGTVEIAGRKRAELYATRVGR
jgi:hypothetical protein